jgi:hypothetical protein
VDCNYAVCYGVRILLPLWLEALVGRLNACWKQVADSADSFGLPDETESRFQPQLDTVMPNNRKDTSLWQPDEKRCTMFKGWTIMGLKGKAVSKALVRADLGSCRKAVPRRHGSRLSGCRCSFCTSLDCYGLSRPYQLVAGNGGRERTEVTRSGGPFQQGQGGTEQEGRQLFNGCGGILQEVSVA